MGLSPSFLRALFSMSSHMPFAKSYIKLFISRVCNSSTRSKISLEENKTWQR